MKRSIIFDVTDSVSIADSDHVGAVAQGIRAGAVQQINSQELASSEWLQVVTMLVDDANSPINAANPLEVAISGEISINDGGNSITVDAVDLDIRDLVFATDKVDVTGSEVSLDAATLAALETVTVLQGTSPWVIGDGGGSITVDAVDLDIRDLTAASDSVASHLFDGAGTALTSTLVGADQALDVNVVGGVNVEVDLSHLDDSIRLGDGTDFFTSTTIGSDIGLDVNVINDASLANTAIATAANTLAVANTAEDVVGSPLANRKYLFLQNDGNKDIFIGPSGVTAANGYTIQPGSEIIMKAGAAVDIEFVGRSGVSGASAALRSLELS